MAKVPTYDSPQVQSSALGAPRTDVAAPKSVAASAEFFGAVEAKQEQAAGAALVGAGIWCHRGQDAGA
jgi:hypothetical protein